MDRDRIVAELRRAFAGRRDIVAARLFGSVARGSSHGRSDIDVGVLLAAGRPQSLTEFGPVTDLQDDLEAALGRPVDVVVMNGAPPDLLHRILRDGILVHESDHRRRLEFELQARNEYWDLLPILERYRRTVLGRA